MEIWCIDFTIHPSLNSTHQLVYFHGRTYIK